MSEEEKKAIEGLFHLAHINTYLDLEKNAVIKISRPIIERWKDETKILLNLVEKQQNFIDEIVHLMYYTDDYVENIFSQIEDLLKDYGIERKFYNDDR